MIFIKKEKQARYKSHKQPLKSRIILLVLLLISSSLMAQSTREAVQYLEGMSQIATNISHDMWEYVRAMAHIQNIAVVNRRRQALIKTVQRSIKVMEKKPAYQGDPQLKDAVTKFLKTLDVIVREDYGKIVDMQAVAEESYDRMEAYFLAKKRANEKLNEASEELMAAEKNFAAANNIRLTHSTDPIGEKLKVAGEVMDYYNNLYLIFFKVNKQELYLIEAFKSRDMGKIEQNRLSLEKASEEALEKIDDLDPYHKDSSVISAGKNYFAFTKIEAKEKFARIEEIMMLVESFQNMKTAMEQKRPEERTQEEVDIYNAKVAQVNAAITESNKILESLNQDRSILIQTWNQTASRFADKHIPQ